MRQKSFFGSKKFYKEALLIAVPIMTQALIQSLVSLVDSFMVAGLGDVKMSGVNIAGQILYIFMVLQSAVCTAGGIFLTQYCGARDKNGMQQAFAFKVLVSFLMSGLYFVVTMVVPRQILGLMVIGNSQAQQILDQGERYMFLMGFVGIPSIFSCIVATSYRETGKVKAPLVITIIATLINTFLNWVFIYGHLGAPRLEIQGAAYATIIARLIEALLFLGYVCKDKPDFWGISAFKKIDFGLFGRILGKGWMIIASQLLWVGSESIASAIYNGRGGADVVSGMSASFTILNMIFISFSGVNTATSVIIGKSLGANKLEQAKDEERWLLSGAVVFGLCMSILCLSSRLLVPVVYGNLSLQAQFICKRMISSVAILIPLWIYNNAQLSALRAGGDTKACMWVDGGVSILTVMLLLILAGYPAIGPVEMYFMAKGLDIGKVVIAHFRLKKGQWIRNLSVE